MSSDNNLQEMEAGTTQSKTAVNAGAKAGDPMQKLAPGAVAGQTGSYEDLGGPTPDNYKSDDDSAKLKTPGATLKQVRDVVNKGAKSADAMKGMKEEEELDSEEMIEEDEEVTAEAEEVVSEEEETEEEVVSEEESPKRKLSLRQKRSKKKRSLMSLRMSAPFSKVKSSRKNSKKKLAPFLKQHSVLRSKRSRKDLLLLMTKHTRSAS